MSHLAPFAILAIDTPAGAPPAEAWAVALAGVSALVKVLAGPAGRETLHASPTGAGFALAIGGTQIGLDLGLGRSPEELATGVVAWLLAADDPDRQEALAPDEGLRRRTAAAARRALPQATDPWTLVLTVIGGASHRIAPALPQPAKPRAESRRSVRMTVTGELARVDFTHGKLALRVEALGRTISGPYLSVLEVKLLKHRRKLVHLTGAFVLDDAGYPRSLAEGLELAPVDLTTITLGAIESECGTLRIDPPLVLTPTLDDATGQLYAVEDPLLEISLEAPTRDALLAALVGEIGARHAAYTAGDTPDVDRALARRWRKRVHPVTPQEASAG